MEEDVESYKITKMYTGKGQSPLPLPKTLAAPSCPIHSYSFRVYRSALMKMFALAQSVIDTKGDLEAYGFMLSDREDLAVTDIYIPRHIVSPVRVLVTEDAVAELTEEISARNARLREEAEKGEREEKEDQESRPERPVKKWRVVGWSHSHGRMSVFFSGEDWENQKAILNSAGCVVDSGGEKYLAVFGMTVNANRKVYAEILARMKCAAEIRQKGAQVEIVEDVDASSEEVWKEIYDAVKTEVVEKVTERSVFPRSRAERVEDRGYTIPLTTYSRDKTSHEMIREINSKVRNSKDILVKALKEAQLSKRWIKGSRQELITIAKRVKGIILRDVADIILYGRIDRGKKKKKGDQRRDQSREPYKYEVIGKLMGKYGKKYDSFGEFVDIAGKVLPDSLFIYLAKNKSTVRDRLEQVGFLFDTETRDAGATSHTSEEEDETAKYEKYLAEEKQKEREVRKYLNQIEYKFPFHVFTCIKNYLMNNDNGIPSIVSSGSDDIRDAFGDKVAFSIFAETIDYMREEGIDFEASQEIEEALRRIEEESEGEQSEDETTWEAFRRALEESTFPEEKVGDLMDYIADMSEITVGEVASADREDIVEWFGLDDQEADLVIQVAKNAVIGHYHSPAKREGVPSHFARCNMRAARWLVNRVNASSETKEAFLALFDMEKTNRDNLLDISYRFNERELSDAIGSTPRESFELLETIRTYLSFNPPKSPFWRSSDSDYIG